MSYDAELDKIINKIKFSTLNKIAFNSSAHGLLPKYDHIYFSIKIIFIKSE